MIKLPNIQEVRKLAQTLAEKQENLEADMQAISNDAQWEGKLVVLPWPETLDLSWLLCCSIPTRECETGHKKPVKGGRK